MDDFLQRTLDFSPRSLKTGDFTNQFLSHDLMLLTAEKDGGFVVAPHALYSARTRQAIDKNFMQLSPDPLTKVKCRAQDLCSALELPTVLNNVKASRKMTLHISFTANTHRPE